MFRINRLLDKEFELPVKTLELNPRHPLLHNLSSMQATDSRNSMIDVVIEQLFETALLQDGIHPDPAAMADRLLLLMQAATGSPLPPIAPDVISTQDMDGIDLEVEAVEEFVAEDAATEEDDEDA
jgi:hypothetical protein